MIREASILLVASLLGLAEADQFSEVYNKDNSFPKFRDPTEFQPPQPELRNVPIDGLPSHQQGYQLLNTQDNQRTQLLTDTQKETVRRQQQFLNSAWEPNVARDQPSPASNLFLGQQPTLSPSRHTSRLLDPPEGTFTARPTFKLRLPEEQATPSTLHTIEFNSFQTEPALINQGSSSVIQHVPLQKNALPDRRPSLEFQDQTTPSYQLVNGFGQDFLKTNVRQQPIVPSVPHDRFTIRKPVVDKQQSLTKVRISGNEHSVRQPESDNFQRLPSNERLVDFRSGEDEEARFISQVNQNTAAGASQINGFQPQLNNFNAVPVSRGTTRRPVNQNPALEDSQGRKSAVFRTRKPVVSVSEDDQFAAVPSPVLPLPDVSRQRPSTRLQNENLDRPEQVANDLEARKQAESAQYNFASSVSDTVNGNSQSRQETRDGLKLTGMYSYSDGYFHRTVFYEADENGYRIVKEENEPIGKGPLYDPNGEIQVDYQHDGSRLNYRIRGDQLKKRPVDKKRPVRPDSDYDDQFQLPL